MKLKSKLINYLKYHHYGHLLIFILLGIILSNLVFSTGYGNISTDIIADYQKTYPANIYLTTFYNDDFIDTTHIFLQNDTDFIASLTNKNPIHFSLPYDIEIETDQYADNICMISSNNQNLLNIQETDGNIHKKNKSYKITEITYDQNSIPTQQQIIKSINDEGVYINESFLKNYNLNLEDINTDTVITFTVHVPLYYVKQNASVVQKIVHAITINRKIKAIIQDNDDLTNVCQAENMILYPLKDCQNLINEYKNLPLSSKYNESYSIEKAYASAYSITSSKENIIDQYNELNNKMSSYREYLDEDEGLMIFSNYYDYQNQNEEINFTKKTVMFITNTVAVISLIYFIFNFKKIKNNDKIKLLKDLPKQETKIYIKKSMFVEIEIFILTWMIIELLLVILFSLLQKEIKTSYLGIFSVSMMFSIIICVTCFIRYIKMLRRYNK